MCGISSIYRFTSFSSDDNQKLSLMNREMHYRGPDDEGLWSDSTCGLAQTRLSIIGLYNGHQPIFNEDKSLVLISNGEIYNYIELKKDLVSKGHIFYTDTDSETIIHLYEEYGVKCLDYLRGMFTFILYNTQTKQLFAARDRVGEKTLYYAQIQTGIVFSTELKAILKYCIDKPQLNANILAQSIRYNYPLDLKNTYIEQIKRLQAGEYALVDSKGLTLHKYWNRNNLPIFEGSVDESKTEILRLLRESVSLCLQSDVPVAILLSGGIDSSAIAAFAKETGREVHVITAGYKGTYDVDERDVAKRFAKERGLIFHEVELDAEDFQNLFDEYTYYIDEPACDVSAMSQWALYKKAKDLGFKVLLGGLGSDEQFYGYPYHNNLAQSLELFRQHRDLFPWKGTEKKIAFLKYIFNHWRHILFAGYPYKLDDTIPVAWTYEDYCKFAKDAQVEWNGENFEFAKEDVHFSFSANTGIDEVYDFMFTRFMTTLCLYLADRLGMGNSVEIRSPFVDYKLVEFVASLPTSMKYRKDNPKGFLKEILRGIVPDYILDGRKRGFEPPFEFIYQINSAYKYKLIQSDHVFYNSMLSDVLLKNMQK